MTQHPLFSVLIANYNNGKYLQEAIDSVVAQTYTNWEVIIVDDCSTDTSSSIYSLYVDNPKFHIYYNENNMGCGYTKRRCAELANGEICGFLDADDALTSEALAVMVKFHQKLPDCSLIYSQYYQTDEHLNILTISNHQRQLLEDESFLLSGSSGAISHFATFKRSYYSKTAGINKAMLRAIDIDLYLNLEEVGCVYFIQTPLYYYRCGTENNISLGDTNSMSALYWDIFARINACIRRGESVEKIVFSGISYRRTSEINAAYRKGEDSVRNSLSYRIGKSLLTPFKWTWKKK